MILPDVNVLLNAFRVDAAHYALCRKWLDDTMSAPVPFGISKLALNSVVRISTDPRVFRNRSSLDEAFGFCEDILGHPFCRVVEPGPTHWSIFHRLCVETNTHGRDVTDAWFAALALESGCEWITIDSDFARFAGLRWRRPD
jgi:toxin-antitoxin system PIN domain toxin